MVRGTGGAYGVVHCGSPGSEKIELAKMATSDAPIIIKKYANRRLYDASSGTHTTLEALAAMAKSGEDFAVYDAKGEDITRSVLTQIVFEQENKEGQSLLPINFLRLLIRFYGDSMQRLVSRYLEVSLATLTRDEEKFRQQIAQAFGSPFGALEDQVRLNMELFERAFEMFLPFARREAQSEPGKAPASGAATSGGAGKQELDELRRQMEEMQQRLDRLSEKDKSGKVF
jgi:polyhydroxyalkanoate synthesis repressor PhaR